MIKAEMRWDREKQATLANVNASGATIELAYEFTEFLLLFASRLNDNAPGLGTHCLKKSLEKLDKDAGAKASAPVTPITPIN